MGQFAAISADFNLSGACDQLTFVATCSGSAGRGASQAYTVDMIDPDNPQIGIGTLVVRR